MCQRRYRRGLMQRPIWRLVDVLAPSHLAGVGSEVFAADEMVLARRGKSERTGPRKMS